VIEPTDEMIDAYRDAVRRGGDSVDDIRREGIAAVLAIVERDYRTEPRPPWERVVHLLTAGDEFVHCCGREIADLPDGERTTLNPHGVTCKGAP
jgi:hypothetical protein